MTQTHREFDQSFVIRNCRLDDFFKGVSGAVLSYKATLQTRSFLTKFIKIIEMLPTHLLSVVGLLVPHCTFALTSLMLALESKGRVKAVWTLNET